MTPAHVDGVALEVPSRDVERAIRLQVPLRPPRDQDDAHGGVHESHRQRRALRVTEVRARQDAPRDAQVLRARGQGLLRVARGVARVRGASGAARGIDSWTRFDHRARRRRDDVDFGAPRAGRRRAGVGDKHGSRDEG